MFSHPGKLDLMKSASEAGYKVYLYFISTEDPAINVERVKKIRVKQGGHDVPEDKIISRYARTMELLDEALELCYHAYLWDNSKAGAGSELFGEMKRGEQGVQWTVDTDKVPLWFMRYVLLKHPDDPILSKMMDDSWRSYRHRLILG